MGQDKKTPVVIDDVEYIYEEMTSEQQALTSHVADLDRKINNTTFQLDQLRVGKDAFIQMLKTSLTKAEEVAEPVVINS